MPNEEPLLIVSSDGHAVGDMESYRDYIEPEFRSDFEDFLPLWKASGAYSISEEALRLRLDDDIVEHWNEEFLDTGVTEGFQDPAKRIAGMDRLGFAAEVLFPDFGTPFTLGGPGRIIALGLKPPSREQLAAGFRAHNRWTADFIQIAPERFAPMASLMFDDVEAAVAEIEWAATAGFQGVLLPPVSDDSQLFDPRYDPIWSALAANNMVANCHVSLSAELPTYGPQPHAIVSFAMFGMDAFVSVQRILRVMLWGGVLDRHPTLKLVFTELQSDWVVPLLARMDFSYEKSDMRREIRDMLPIRPSEYWQRQCFLGSSIFSRAECGAREQIGVDKMMLGFDYPHFEGAWRLGVNEYLRATLGEVGAPVEHARRMAGLNAIDVFNMDGPKLTEIAKRIGPSPTEVLTPLDEPLMGISADLNRPLQTIQFN